ncbi:SURF1 family protein [Novosphingobium rosa]|uniref:SURF1 family protein n=1 Tax=Novosphingobium rosa TaxID=76978 RepID=UPI000835B928|nr:SURF1 family cytochrome oxidase biogenesis protein [Novosphingobium rosa]
MTLDLPLATEGKTGGRRQFMLVAALLAFAALFVALGVWQVKRLAWKEALIARVNEGLSATPQTIDAVPTGLPGELLKAAEYRRFILHGRWIAQGTTLVTGASAYGTGYWVLTPLATDSGRILYINRGYVPMGTTRDAVIAATPAVPVEVTGLLRLTEPHGGFLRGNDPAADRWASRDIFAIAAHRHIAALPDWFIDAQSMRPDQPVDAAITAHQPMAGLTVVSFPNNHLGYAITWFTLALLSLGAIVLVRRQRA